MNRIRNQQPRSAATAVGAFLCLAASFALAQHADNSGLKPALAPLAYFTGDWECSGKFDSSGNKIYARQHFAPDLDGSWILFRHDDKPPFTYHALSEWGWDEGRKQFVMTVQDSSGGVRWFHSRGWDASLLRWDGDAMGSTASLSQRFQFERLDDRHFNVSYFSLKNDIWSRVDLSTCSRQ
jgi:hypothetical protein